MCAAEVCVNGLYTHWCVAVMCCVVCVCVLGDVVFDDSGVGCDAHVCTYVRL